MKISAVSTAKILVQETKFHVKIVTLTFNHRKFSFLKKNYFSHKVIVY